MKNIILIVFILIFWQCAEVNAKIYKYTDEQGNIHYSDTKPFADAKEANIKAVNIVESDTTASNNSTKWKSIKRTAKKKGLDYSDFAIAKPVEGEHIWGTGGNIQVSVNLKKLPKNYRIKFFLDGMPHGKVKQNTQLIADVIRGEHSIYAQLVDANSRKVLKTTKKVNFYVKQHSKK